jgi:hypothetical protein
MVINLTGKSLLGERYGTACQRIRRSVMASTGIVVMEHLTHHQNLAHCRRQLAEAELATSSDEIRHSMLMRLLAEEEANVLVMPVAMTVVRPNRRAAG